MSEKLIVEGRVRALLLRLPSVCSVGQEVLDMLSDGVRVAAETTIMDMCRITPGGRLLLKEDKPGQPDAVDNAYREEHEAAHGQAWGDYNDWQTERRAGATKLSFEMWRARRKETGKAEERT